MYSVWTAQQIQGGRSYQEDRFAIVENNSVFYAGEQFFLGDDALPSHQSLYILVDGMGGMGNGDVAAEKAIETFVQSYINVTNSKLTIAQKFKSALSKANAIIAQLVADNDGYEGMGCTLIAVLFDSNDKTIQWVSVGDSPLFLITDKEMVRINEKHTWGELGKQKKAMGESIDEEHYKKVFHFLSSAVDGGKIDFIEIHDEPFPIQHSFLLMLASDGLETLSISQMETVLLPLVKKIQWQATKPESAIEQVYESIVDTRKELFERVNKAGLKNQDNTTLVLSAFLDLTLQSERKE